MAGAKLYEEEAQALDDVLKCIFGFTKVGAVRCVIELGIPDIVENYPGGVTLAQLSSELGCSSVFLHRLMRFLTHHRMFKEVKRDSQDSPTAYAQTAFSRLLIRNNLAPFFLFMTCPDVMTSMLNLSKFLVSKNSRCAFEEAHGVDIWQYMAANPSFSDLYHKGMACRARSMVPSIIQNCMAAFEGIGSLVDVGGGKGTTLRAVVKACPWITRAINFDLPYVVSSNTKDGLVEHVGGDMFVAIPSADAVLINSVLHDWDDDACLKILKNCKESIPEEAGKVIIVDALIDDDEGNDKYRDLELALDVEMMAHTIKGKERTSKEWADLLTSAGFSKHTIKHIPPLQTIIVAYP